MSNLQSALAYARKGLFVMPCRSGDKRPIPETGLLEATTDPGQITKWWTDSPTANVAISCGPSGLVVIDIDPRHGGDASFEGLRAEFGGATFNTKSQLTPSGGIHYFFRAPNEPIANSASVLGPGIDIRGAGGYVLVPPSVIAGRQYAWEASSRDLPLAEFPKGLEGRLRARNRVFESADAVIVGGRNQYLTSMAGSLRRKGLSISEIYAAIKTANAERCKPPLSDREVGSIAKSIGRYTPSDPIRVPEPVQLGLLSFEQLCERTSAEQDWAIDRLLLKSGILLLSGLPKEGKSTLARNLALALAQGGMFLGRRCARGKVIWVGLEEPSSHLRHRLEAMGAAGLPIIYRVDPFVGDEVAWLRAAIEQENPLAVVIDTIGRFANVEDINSYSQVTRATRPVLELRDRCGTSFVLLHHSNDAGNPLGSKQWRGTADALLGLSKSEDGTRFVKSLGQRSGEEIEPTAIAMNPKTFLIEPAKMRLCEEEWGDKEEVAKETGIEPAQTTVWSRAEHPTLPSNENSIADMSEDEIDTMLAESGLI